MQDVQTTLSNGTVLGNRYTVEGLLGKGGFGAVYLVKDNRVKGNLFALKEVIDPDKQERARFAFEGEVLKRLDHPSLPRVYRVFQDDKNNRLYMLMDYIEGPNLEALRQKQPNKRFPLEQVLNIMAPIMNAVSYLHEQKPPIIHRDIKPANIIVSPSGNEVALVDFGIAKEYDPDSTTTAVRRCSPGYGAPEQYSRGTNTRTDIYGLGATIYALLTGEVPDDAFYRMTQLGSNGKDPLTPVKQLVPSVPVHVSQAIQKAMAINSKERFASAADFWHALNAEPASPDTPIPEALAVPVDTGSHAAAASAQQHDIEDLQTVTVRHIPAPVTTVRRRRILPLLLLVLAFLIVAATIAAAMFLSHSGSNSTHTAPVPTRVVYHAVTPTAKPKPTMAPTPTSAPTQSIPTPSPTTAPVTPTSPPAAFPDVSGTHNGSVHNNNINANASMTATFQQDTSGNLSGNVTISMPLQGSGSITSGFVGANRYIQFVVSPRGIAPLLFTGNVAGDGSMAGTYCSIDASGKCNAAVGGSGSWQLNAIQAPSPSISRQNSFVLPSLTEKRSEFLIAIQ